MLRGEDALQESARWIEAIEVLESTQTDSRFRHLWQMRKAQNRSVVIALLNLLAVVASQTALARHFNLQESNSSEFYHEGSSGS